ncbi:pantetheine-phosphate adenylyltransferase [Oharaeibacter diazotrophicus]|uniref:Phosphopantetheine adenylyltransferase n=1 Tax=Oharaeibacter diazotrophicus TaxID=1920512 RepID=A0A4R6RJE5_9HYPH|nr:pantetheine-phosphate adenylyltransferase [Oharaeibacter diazotrophicus]TDP86643.1 phosphopantetheine adenylyltransferase [Oharaeibacter diazotrophicus]BBE71416.1 phosphopantetheine adenylyltransferase [Pleomorphomonas sp. SM30]GLS78173.1 phosphopantetheine adenylyltransferase [Oharaeibacter diazotrophicus]
MTTALYSGSFDPATFGHLDVVRRAARLFDRLVIAVGAHHSKSAVFTPEERVEMLRALVAPIAAETGRTIEVATFDGLVVDAARAAGAGAIVRGLRSVTDFDYEVQMGGMNGAMAPEIDVVYLAAAADVRHIASSLVRQIAALGGPVEAFVPALVAERLVDRYRTPR